ncbi:transcriptional regulator, TetR family [Sphingobium faniae]|nr:transcriptional regulator, TetR family [Sphingobium faniae]
MIRPARQKTPDVIVQVAEVLWGERGLDGASLREIAVAAGLANPASVQYHFGGKEALIWAIFSSRLPVIDARRAALMAQVPVDGVRPLLDCLFRPLFEQCDARGRRSYAAFLAQVLRHGEAGSLRERAMTMTPATDALLRRLTACGPALPSALAAHRLVAINLLVLDVIGGMDRDKPAALPPDRLYEDAIDMAAGALTAPFS